MFVPTTSKPGTLFSVDIVTVCPATNETRLAALDVVASTGRGAMNTAEDENPGWLALDATPTATMN